MASAAAAPGPTTIQSAMPTTTTRPWALGRVRISNPQRTPAHIQLARQMRSASSTMTSSDSDSVSGTTSLATSGG